MPFNKNTFYIIPSSIYFICLQFFGNHINYYWGSGNNKYGQLGLPNRGVAEPFALITSIKDLHIRMHKLCSSPVANKLLWITTNGKMYVSGGYLKGTYDVRKKPELCMFFVNKSLKIIDAACTDHHTVVLCDNGSVWSVGENYYGQLGHKKERNADKIQEFKQIETFKNMNEKIISVSVGNSFSMFLGENGNVFGCGYCQGGALGIALRDRNNDQSGIPTKIRYFEENDIKIVEVVCGEYHVLALDDNGNIWSWGENSKGQCGINKDDKLIHTPHLIESLKDKEVVEIRCGTDHSGCITLNGEYYLWGRNDYHQCGPIFGNKVYGPVCVNDYIFNKTKSKIIINMELGDDTTMFIIGTV